MHLGIYLSREIKKLIFSFVVSFLRTENGLTAKMGIHSVVYHRVNERTRGVQIVIQHW